MEIKKLSISGGKRVFPAEAFPVSELNNHLIVVRVGYNGYMPPDEEIEECWDLFNDAEVLEQMDNASFLIALYDMDIKKYRPTDFKPLRPLPWRHRFKRIWLALKGW
jgi:hypothetical protein